MFKFSVGIHRNLDDVRERILSRQPVPSTREVFSEIRQEESHVMLNSGRDEEEMSAFVNKKFGPPKFRPNFEVGPGNMGYS